jgi:hypothetical protein
MSGYHADTMALQKPVSLTISTPRNEYFTLTRSYSIAVRVSSHVGSLYRCGYRAFGADVPVEDVRDLLRYIGIVCLQRDVVQNVYKRYLFLTISRAILYGKMKVETLKVVMDHHPDLLEWTEPSQSGKGGHLLHVACKGKPSVEVLQFLIDWW